MRRKFESLDVGSVHLKGDLDVPALLKSVQAGLRCACS
jgi:hypothetical protein